MKITECPRDAIQGIKDFIPTEMKTKYINTLLRVGFDTIDFGSFVSPKAVPQMKDVKEVVKGLFLSDTNTKLLAIVGNRRGAEDLVKFDEISVIGYPFSISNTFLKKNINSSIDDSLNRLDEIIDLNTTYDKDIVVYISMGFGNPYGDEWNIDILMDYIDVLYDMGINRINISDTIGIATPKSIKNVFEKSFGEFDDINFGFHLHTQKENWYAKVNAAYEAGVNNFDSVIYGKGGCPMSGYELVGNLDTKSLVDFFFDKDVELNINKEWFDRSIKMGEEIFSTYN
jgi:hydroxymethylglutaryl-CoA lyase